VALIAVGLAATAAAVFWDHLGAGLLLGGAVLLTNISVRLLWLGRRTVVMALNVANLTVSGVGFTLFAYHTKDVLTHVELSAVQRAGILPQPGLHRVVLRAHRTLYELSIPDESANDGPRPAVVLLHGNGGSGREIIRDTKWDEVAREKGWGLVVPTSPGATWSDDADEVVIGSLNDACSRYPIDMKRILLTGRSDGATWCYIVGLRYPEAFRAIAPVSGSWWPLARLHASASRSVAVYIYHSKLDTIFPVQMARKAAAVLRKTGHDVEYHEDAAGGHAYSPAEARRIADWFAELVGEPAARGGRR